MNLTAYVTEQFAGVPGKAGRTTPWWMRSEPLPPFDSKVKIGRYYVPWWAWPFEIPYRLFRIRCGSNDLNS